MDNTKIEWADASWNPVTGCRHNCYYCYARNMARRFAFRIAPDPGHGWGDNQYSGKECECGKIHVVEAEPLLESQKKRNPYPYGFDPTFHEYRLDIPQHWRKPRNIFVCSMADLFGAWVPDSWIEKVFAACDAAPQHNYIFLTKNGGRYGELLRSKILWPKENMWFGQTSTGHGDFHDVWRLGYRVNQFISVEPLTQSPQDLCKRAYGGAPYWIIIGAMTGPSGKRNQPTRAWVEEICEMADLECMPVFMKDSLIPIVGEEKMRRELPKGLVR